MSEYECFQCHAFFGYTDVDGRAHGRHGRLTSSLSGLGQGEPIPFLFFRQLCDTSHANTQA